EQLVTRADDRTAAEPSLQLVVLPVMPDELAPTAPHRPGMPDIDLPDAHRPALRKAEDPERLVIAERSQRELEDRQLRSARLELDDRHVSVAEPSQRAPRDDPGELLRRPALEREVEADPILRRRAVRRVDRPPEGGGDDVRAGEDEPVLEQTT